MSLDFTTSISHLHSTVKAVYEAVLEIIFDEQGRKYNFSPSLHARKTAVARVFPFVSFLSPLPRFLPFEKPSP